jgi:hypothetical protein
MMAFLLRLFHKYLVVTYGFKGRLSLASVFPLGKTAVGLIRLMRGKQSSRLLLLRRFSHVFVEGG